LEFPKTDFKAETPRVSPPPQFLEEPYLRTIGSVLYHFIWIAFLDRYDAAEIVQVVFGV
jgi:hypothetical protein